ncbi:MAG: ABC transporter ATP-binding protein [Oscillospiraceae bacterium]|jgi:ATP-binding cassette subfamily B protein|nr:ABC transporter ATP-binding protein [Oscillospiraceae bacterium]
MAKEKPRYSMYKAVGYMLGKAWQGHKGVLVMCILTALLAVAENLVGLFIAPSILKQVENAAPVSALLWTIVIFAAALIACRGLSSYLNTASEPAQTALRFDVAMDVCRKTISTSYPNIGDPEISKLHTKALEATQSNWASVGRIWFNLTGLLQNLLCFAVYLMLLSNLDPILMVVVLGTAIISHLVSRWYDGWEFRHEEEDKRYFSKFYYIDDKATDIALAKDVRIFGMTSWLSRVYHSNLSKWLDFRTKSQKVYFCGDAIGIAIGLVRSTICYGYLITMTLREGLPASQFLLYFTAITGFTGWVTGILDQISGLHWMAPYFSRLLEYLHLPEPFHFEDGEPLKPVSDGIYELRLDHVSFRYPGAEEDAVHDIDLTIKSGEKLAIVGLNGAGKTTLVKLMSGFLDPTEGRVLLNGVDIRRYNRRDYYDHFSAVFQQFSTLACSFAENVAQTSQNIDRKRVEHCLGQAGLLDRINELGGIDAHMGREVYEDGILLSGGETQRLVLARALYKNAPIILLDEPTAALDPIAEDDLYHKYSDLTEGRTSVYISHRLASTRFCDRILVMDKGQITEEGTHESLLTAGGGYAEMFEVQRHYYQEGAMDDEQED